MKIANLFKKLSSICFLLLWVPFAVAMIRGPLAPTIWGSGEAFPDVWIWVGLAVGLGVLAATLMILSLLLGGFANIRIMAKGTDADAIVRSIERTGTTVNDDPMVDFFLEVRPKTAPPFSARARKLVSLVDLPAYQPGKHIRVRYVPGSDQVAIVDERDKAMLRSKGLLVED